MMRLVALLVVLPLAVACDGDAPLEPLSEDALVLQVDLEVTRGESHPVGPSGLDFSVEATDGGILLKGQRALGHTGYQLTGRAWQDGSIVRLDIDAERTSSGLPVVSRLDYEASVTGIAPGSYELQVVHRIDETETLAYSASVRIR